MRRAEWGWTVVRGAGIGLVAGTVQVAVGKALDAALLSEKKDRENADIAPRLMQRLSERTRGKKLSEPAKWSAGTAFHYGYSVFWGVAYAALCEWRQVPAVVGGLGLGGILWLLAFSPWGAGVHTGTERPPGRRTGRMELVTWAVAMTFGVCTAGLEGVTRDPSPSPSPVGRGE